MVAEPKVKQCLDSKSFKILDDVHCNLGDGADVLKAHVKALRDGKKKGISRSIDFLQGAVDRIDSGLGLGNSAEVPGFGGAEAIAIKKDTIDVTKKLTAARKTGIVPPAVLSSLDNIGRRAQILKERVTTYRSADLFSCLTEK